MARTYSELITIPSFKKRFEYLRLDGTVGKSTFGFDRYLNQKFYRSREWKNVRDYVIVRDQACDLAFPDFEICGKVYIHHMNPVFATDFTSMSNALLDPDNLVCVTHETHNAIHYGDESLLYEDPIERRPNDTCPWKTYL